MSYCRFSSNNWDCNVYCYAHVDGGFVIHVAGRRAVHQHPCPPLPEQWWEADKETLMQAFEAQERWNAEATYAPIGLPHDGETFTLATAEETADKLEELAAIGYHVPQAAIDVLREEAAEEGA